jgi:hypothetical protein
VDGKGVLKQTAPVGMASHCRARTGENHEGMPVMLLRTVGRSVRSCGPEPATVAAIGKRAIEVLDPVINEGRRARLAHQMRESEAVDRASCDE